jgi:2-dehydro-3-deoxygalactonokinase
VVTGKKVMKQAFAALIGGDNFFRGEIIAVDDELADDLAGLGAMAIARERGLIGEAQSTPSNCKDRRCRGPRSR